MKHCFRKAISLVLVLLLTLTAGLSTVALAGPVTDVQDAYSVINPANYFNKENFADNTDHIGSTTQNGFLQYKVDFGETPQTITGFGMEGALPNNQGNVASISVYANALPGQENSQLIATLTPKPTTETAWNVYWPHFAKAEPNVSLSGVKDIYLQISTGGSFGNIGNFTFYTSPRFAYTENAAASYDEGETVTLTDNIVSGLDDGDYLLYKDIDFYNGLNAVSPLYFAANVNVAAAGGKIQVRLDDKAAEPIAELTVSQTSGSYRYQYANIKNGSVTPGKHDVYLTFTGTDICSMKDFAFYYNKRDAFSTILAYQPDGNFGGFNITNGGTMIGSTNSTGAVWYNAVDFGERGSNKIVLNYATPDDRTDNKQIQIFLDAQTKDGEAFATLLPPTTGGFDNFQSVTLELPEKITGAHTILIGFTDGYYNLRSFSFIKAPKNDNIFVDEETLTISDSTDTVLYGELLSKQKEIKANMEICNLTGTALNANFYMGTMKDDGTVSELSVTTIPFSADATQMQSIHTILNLEEYPAVGHTFKMFVWNDEMQPCLDTPVSILCTPYPEYGAPIIGNTFIETNGAMIEADGSNNVGHINVGTWIKYRNVNFGDGCTRFVACIGRQEQNPGDHKYFDIRLDSPSGTLLGTLEIAATENGFHEPFEQYAELNAEGKALTGFHTICLVGRSSDIAGGIGTYSWIQFDNEPIPAE